jgi:hypothetical protein
MDIALHRARSVTAEAGNGADNGSWLDLIMVDEAGAEHTITLYFDRRRKGAAAAYASAINAANKPAFEAAE